MADTTDYYQVPTPAPELKRLDFLVGTWQTKGVEYIEYDEPNKRFHTHYFDSNGPYDEEGSTYEGEMRGKNAVFCGPARITYAPSADGATMQVTAEMLSRQTATPGARRT